MKETNIKTNKTVLLKIVRYLNLLFSFCFGMFTSMYFLKDCIHTWMLFIGLFSLVCTIIGYIIYFKNYGEVK